METEVSLPCSKHQATCHYPVTDESNLRKILILSAHLRLGLPGWFFPSGFPIKTMFVCVLSPIRVTCPAHHMLRGLTPPMTFVGEYNWWIPRYTLFGTATENLQKEVFSNSRTTSTNFLQHGVQRGSETLPSCYRNIIKSSVQRHQNGRSTSWLQPQSAVQVGSGDSSTTLTAKELGASDASQQVLWASSCE